MNVSSILEIYTTFAGWIFNNVMVDILKLGFIAIPFFLMIVINMRDALKSGNFKSSVEIAVKNIETDFYEMILVALFVFVPFHPIELGAINYDTPSVNFLSREIPETVTAENDPSTYATTINPTVSEIQTEYGNPKVPIILYLILKISYGANYTLTKSLIESNARNDLSAADYSLSQFGLNDPVLSSELMQFNADCFRRARSKFIDLSADGSIGNFLPPVAVEALRDNPDDINSFGSIVFQNTPGLYKQCNDPASCRRTLKASRPIEGWSYDASRDGVRLKEAEGLPGQPRCDEWWNNLRDRVVDSAPEAQSVWQKVKANFGITLTGNDKDFLAKRIIRNTYIQSQSQTPITMAGLNAGRGLLDEIHVSLSDLGLKLSAFKEGFKTEGVRNAIYILLALALMMLYVNTPILLLFMGLRLKGLLVIAGLMFTLIMAHSVLTLVEFLEVAVYNAVYGDRTGFFVSSVRMDMTVYQYIMNIAYPLAIALYFILINTAINGAATIGASVGDRASAIRPSKPPKI